MRLSQVVGSMLLLGVVLAVKVKVVMRPDQEDSKIEEDEPPRTESNWERAKTDGPMLPFLKHKKHVEEVVEYEEEKTTEKPRQMHPNDMIFPLIYRQNHINSMFKFGENWYTWSSDKRADGSKAVNYYICYDEPKRCDDIGWERTDAPPKCAFQIDSVMADDRACVNTFGMEPHAAGLCDGAEQMKVSDIVHSCGPRIRSLWRFLRAGRRPSNAAKPADVNSLVCEDEEECFITIEYRIHHDRITFSLHEPTRGQTFKSVLKRDTPEDDKVTTAPEVRRSHQRKKIVREEIEEPTSPPRKKIHLRPKLKVKSKTSEGKGVIKERNDSAGSSSRRSGKNKIKIHHDKITFSQHERSRGQTFKSVLNRDTPEDDKVTTVPEVRRSHQRKNIVREESEEPVSAPRQKIHLRPKLKVKSKTSEGKGVIEERNESAGSSSRRSGRYVYNAKGDNISENSSE